MRVLVVLVAAALLLSGCSLEREWKGDLAFKVTKINPPYTDKSGEPKPAFVLLELDRRIELAARERVRRQQQRDRAECHEQAPHAAAPAFGPV